MPLYEYRCGKCGAVFELLVKSARASAGAACARCGSRKTTKLFSRFGFTSGATVRTSTGSGGCASCRPSPGKCRGCSSSNYS